MLYSKLLSPLNFWLQLSAQAVQSQKFLLLCEFLIQLKISVSMENLWNCIFFHIKMHVWKIGALSYHRYLDFFSCKLLHLSSRKGWTHTKHYRMQELSSLRAQIPWMHREVTCNCFFSPPAPLLSQRSGWERHKCPVGPTQRFWSLLELLSLPSTALGDHGQFLT